MLIYLLGCSYIPVSIKLIIEVCRDVICFSDKDVRDNNSSLYWMAAIFIEMRV